MPSLTVYIDFKSPYAYLAIEPTRVMARELDIDIDWQPFVLDIPSYLGSAKLNKQGEVVSQSRSAEQWSGVKYAYFDCRRYANLRGLTIRGTTKIWDTNLAAIGMLWAKQQAPEVLNRYIDKIYEPFWKRALDVEDIAVIERVLAAAGAQVRGFKGYAQDGGAREHLQLQETIFNGGIYGVPTYVVGEHHFFGREHLPRVRWHLQGEQGTAPDIAYSIADSDTIEPVSKRHLAIGLNDSVESCLAVPALLELIEQEGLETTWFALPKPVEKPMPSANDHSRAERHRFYRAQNRRLDRERYDLGGLPQPTDGAAIPGLLSQAGFDLDSPAPDDIAVYSVLSSPVFRLGGEIFVGRQHLPLISARLRSG